MAQEGKRFAASNAENLTTHISTLESLIIEYGLDADRIWNLDETGATPGRDASGRTQAKRFTRQNASTDVKLEEFIRTSRMTMMPCVSASGECAPPLFVFKGRRVPYHQILVGGQTVSETYA